MSEELKLQRTREQWAKCEPKLMVQQSQAAVMYALQDAKRDIDALHRHADKLRAELAALKAGQCEAVAIWDGDSDVGRPIGYVKIADGAELYTAPPATGVIVERELLELAVSIPSRESAQANTNGILARGKAQAKIRALLAQSKEVRS